MHAENAFVAVVVTARSSLPEPEHSGGSGESVKVLGLKWKREHESI